MLATIVLFDALKTRFGENETKIIVNEMEQIEKSIGSSVEKEFDCKKDSLATKEDVGRLEAKSAYSGSHLTMRMFFFWIGQIAVSSGTMTYFFITFGH